MRLTGQYWPGVNVGVGIGLLCGAALVELGVLALNHKAWASGLGILLVVVGNVLSRRVRAREAAEVATRE